MSERVFALEQTVVLLIRALQRKGTISASDAEAVADGLIEHGGDTQAAERLAQRIMPELGSMSLRDLPERE
jgi:hypothetical protein